MHSINHMSSHQTPIKTKRCKFMRIYIPKRECMHLYMQQMCVHTKDASIISRLSLWLSLFFCLPLCLSVYLHFISLLSISLSPFHSVSLSLCLFC